MLQDSLSDSSQGKGLCPVQVWLHRGKHVLFNLSCATRRRITSTDEVWTTHQESQYSLITTTCSPAIPVMYVAAGS
jgi:hypothetical protein